MDGVQNNSELSNNVAWYIVNNIDQLSMAVMT
jgi:hypothetical protein